MKIKRGLITLSAIISLSGCFSEKQLFMNRDFVPINSINMQLNESVLEKGNFYDVYTSHKNPDYHGHLEALRNLKYERRAYNKETGQFEEKFLASNSLGQTEVTIQSNRIRYIQQIKD